MPPAVVISEGPVTRTAVTVAVVVVVVGVGDVTLTVRVSVLPPHPTASTPRATHRLPAAPAIPNRPCIPLLIIRLSVAWSPRVTREL
ncbi:hypothetical protein TBR22_A47510 [Luteitalea sp. TBR-22]|nr:hypothetical protein TBR22_A47510 [Luteitalea sp. TBR-22]